MVLIFKKKKHCQKSWNWKAPWGSVYSSLLESWNRGIRSGYNVGFKFLSGFMNFLIKIYWVRKLWLVWSIPTLYGFKYLWNIIPGSIIYEWLHFCIRRIREPSLKELAGRDHFQIKWIWIKRTLLRDKTRYSKCFETYLDLMFTRWL